MVGIGLTVSLHWLLADATERRDGIGSFIDRSVCFGTSRICKHGLSFIRLVNLPIAKILVESDCLNECVQKGSSARNIPFADVLVKDFCPSKRLCKVFDIWNVPAANILIEGFCTFKHLRQSRCTGYIPAANILIEGDCIVEVFFKRCSLGYNSSIRFQKWPETETTL